jgi:hypothetical protein
MNIVDALVAHHGVLRRLYQSSMDDPTVFDEFVRHLTVHHTMEEKYFYDLLKRKAQSRHDALEAVNEHHYIELIIQDSVRFPREHELFAIKVEGLGEYTSHHLDEEEAEIFPAARELFSEQELELLGPLFLAAKENLLSAEIPPLPDALASDGTAPAADTVDGSEMQSGSGIKSRGPEDLGIGSLKQ